MSLLKSNQRGMPSTYMNMRLGYKRTEELFTKAEHVFLVRMFSLVFLLGS